MMSQEELERMEKDYGTVSIVRRLLDHINYLQEIQNLLRKQILTQFQLLTKRIDQGDTLTLNLEIERLKSGQFTPDELQNLCHNLSPQQQCAFKFGCEKYQKELFGKGAVEEEMERCIRWVEGAEPFIGKEWVEDIVQGIRNEMRVE